MSRPPMAFATRPDVAEEADVVTLKPRIVRRIVDLLIGEELSADDACFGVVDTAVGQKRGRGQLAPVRNGSSSRE